MSAPIILCDTAGMTNERWLECRAHGPKGTIPYTVEAAMWLLSSAYRRGQRRWSYG